MSKKINATNVTFSETNMTYRRVLLSDDQKLACEIYINQPKQGELGPKVTFKPVIRLNVNGVDKLFVVSFNDVKRNISTRYLVHDKYYDIDDMLYRIEHSIEKMWVETIDGVNYYHTNKYGRRTWKEAIVSEETGIVTLEYSSTLADQSDDEDDTDDVTTITRIEIPVDRILRYATNTPIIAQLKIIGSHNIAETVEMYAQCLGNAR